MGKLSDVMPEPADGTMVVLIHKHGGGPYLIWRDDEESQQCSTEYPEERWFDGSTTDDPLDWAEVTKYAEAAHIVPARPDAKVAP